MICLFLFGGNDGHNMVVPLGATEYAAYTAVRGGLALTPAELLPVSDPILGNFGFHYGMPELQTLFNQGDLAILANTGVLVTPTRFSNLASPSFPLPSNLRSHADQVVQMQAGDPTFANGTGWGGRTIDVMQSAHAYNVGTSFPTSISLNSPALFCTGATVQSFALQPGNQLDQSILRTYPPAAVQATAAAQQQILSANSGNDVVDAANRVMASAVALNPLLKAAAGTLAFQKPFPSTPLGDQLKEIARVISLNAQLGIGRQVFFASIGGFDTHAGQDYQQWSLLQQVSAALDAFYAATVQLTLQDRVTTFTLSDFGRTLQPSGNGTDHGWGNHHLILGGAVKGGRIHGRFPLMRNYVNFNATADDYADARGVLLPAVSLVQYGATLAKWFGATDAEQNALFPVLPSFPVRDLGFMGP
ncbi:Hypothetical protein A7982_00228 [Minicystis rosea]|nr:Hypothetical protein A7982_00228 [Minicystis rosea]